MRRSAILLMMVSLAAAAAGGFALRQTQAAQPATASKPAAASMPTSSPAPARARAPAGKPAPAPAPAPAAAPDPNKPLTTKLDLGNNVSMEVVLVPKGKFAMGSGDKGDDVKHEVTIGKPFYMGATVVTADQFEAVMGHKAGDAKGDCPAEPLTFKDATDFCQKMSAKTQKTVRLPTEAEWEYACRAGSIGSYSFGDDVSLLKDYAWYSGNRQGQAQPVGQKKPNAFGLYDMHGNVMEWVSDWYGPYAKGQSKDPTGPDKGDYRVARGGCWSSDPEVCKSAYRVKMALDSKGASTGLRVVVEP